MRYFYLFLVLSLIYSTKARHIRKDGVKRIIADEKLCHEEYHNGILWEASGSGSVSRSCPGNYTSTDGGKTTRMCNSDGTWTDNNPPCYPRIADSFELDVSHTMVESVSENGFTIYKSIKISFKGDCQGLSNDVLKVIVKYNYTNNYNYTFKNYNFNCGKTEEVDAKELVRDNDIKSSKMHYYLEVENSDIEIVRKEVVFGCIPDIVDFTSFPTYIVKDSVGIGVCLNDTISKLKPNRKCKNDGNWDVNIQNPCYYPIDTNILKFDDSKINRFINSDNNDELCFNGTIVYNFPYECNNNDNNNGKTFLLSLYYQTKGDSTQYQIDKEIEFKCQNRIEFKIDQSKCFTPTNYNNVIFFLLKSDNKIVIQNQTYVLGCGKILNDNNDNWNVSLVGGNIEGYCAPNTVANSETGKPIRECSDVDGEWKIPKYRCIEKNYKDIKLELNSGGDDNSITMENDLFYLNNIKLNNEKIENCIKGSEFSIYYNYIIIKNNQKEEKENLFSKIVYNCEKTLTIQPNSNGNSNKISFKPSEIQLISMKMTLSSDKNKIISYVSIPLGCSSQFNIFYSNFNSSSLYLHEVIGECTEGSTTLSLSNPYPKAICRLNNKLEIINPCYYDINHIKIDINNLKSSLSNNKQFCLNGKLDLIYESSCNSELQPPTGTESTQLKLYYYYEDESQLNLLTQTKYECKEGVIYSYNVNELCLSEVKYSKINFYLVHSDGIKISTSSKVLGCPTTTINKYILPISTPTIINNNSDSTTTITYVDGECIDGYNYTIKPSAACNEYGEWENSTGLCYLPSYTDIEFDVSQLKVSKINNQLTVSGFVKLYQNSTCDDQPIKLPLELFIKIENTEKSIYKFDYVCKNNSEIGTKVLENKITQVTENRMATLILKYNNQNVKEMNIYVPCPSLTTSTSLYPETNAGEMSIGICTGDYSSNSPPTRLCNIDGTWSEDNYNDNCKIESFISKWGGLIFGILGGAIFLLLLSCFLVYWFHRKHISHWKSKVEEMDNRWKEHNDGEIQKVEFNATSNTKRVINNNSQQQQQQQHPNLFIPDQSNSNNNNSNNNVNINANTLFPKNTWLKQQAEVGYDDDGEEYEYEEGEEEEYEEEYEEEGEEYEENGIENGNGYYEEKVNKHDDKKKKRLVNTLEKIDEEEDEGDDEFNY